MKCYRNVSKHLKTRDQRSKVIMIKQEGNDYSVKLLTPSFSLVVFSWSVPRSIATATQYASGNGVLIQSSKDQRNCMSSVLYKKAMTWSLFEEKKIDKNV